MKRVLELFEEICKIPHGSGNQAGIADFCQSFGKGLGLEVLRDEDHNVIIQKPGTAGYENAPSVMLQGHLDMVCQKDEGVEIDFEKDGIQTVVEGDMMHALGTTLGADNGIAAAMILAILERNDLSHPPLEAVFTTDEEIGMVGARKMDTSVLKSRRMINLDSEEDDVVTVSCAGGSDFIMRVPLNRERLRGTAVTLRLKGMMGGHSGVEIHKGRINADLLMGRVLCHLMKECDLSLVSLSGGDKSNAIPRGCEVCLVPSDPAEFREKAEGYLSEVKAELSAREPDFSWSLEVGEEGEWSCIEKGQGMELVSMLVTAPDGVMSMSREIEGLVETSLNLGVLKTSEEEMTWHFALRSNKSGALSALEEKMLAFSGRIPCHVETFGHYPPWEYREDSPLREAYLRLYRESVGEDAKVEAIHAGLECGVFASALKGLDAIAIGPTLLDVHTTSERMSLSSVKKVYTLLCRLLEELQ